MEHQWKKKLASRLYVGDLIIIVKIHGTTPQYVEKLTNDISRSFRTPPGFEIQIEVECERRGLTCDDRVRWGKKTAEHPVHFDCLVIRRD